MAKVQTVWTIVNDPDHTSFDLVSVVLFEDVNTHKLGQVHISMILSTPTTNNSLARR